MYDRYGSAEDPALAWGPEGKLLAVYLHDGTIGIWEIPDRPRPRKIDDPLYVLKDENSHPAHFMAFSPDGTLLAVNIGLPGKSPVIWNLATQEIVQELNIPGLCRRGRWLPSGNHLAVGCDEGVFLWSVEEERFVWEGTAHNGRVREVGVSDDEQQLVSLSWSELIVWDVESGEVLSTTILSEKIPGYCPTSP